MYLCYLLLLDIFTIFIIIKISMVSISMHRALAIFQGGFLSPSSRRTSKDVSEYLWLAIQVAKLFSQECVLLRAFCKTPNPLWHFSSGEGAFLGGVFSQLGGEVGPLTPLLACCLEERFCFQASASCLGDTAC